MPLQKSLSKPPKRAVEGPLVYWWRKNSDNDFAFLVTSNYDALLKAIMSTLMDDGDSVVLAEILSEHVDRSDKIKMCIRTPSKDQSESMSCFVSSPKEIDFMTEMIVGVNRQLGNNVSPTFIVGYGGDNVRCTIYDGTKSHQRKQWELILRRK